GGNDKRSFEEWNDEEKMAGLRSILAKPGVKEGILGTFGAIAGGIGSVLGATGGNDKREVQIQFDDMTDEEKMTSLWKYVPSIAAAIGGVLGLGAGAAQ